MVWQNATVITTTIALCFLMAIVNIDSNVKKMELVKACESGFLTYVTKYRDAELDVFEKQRRIRFMHKKCTEFAEIYLEAK